MKFSPVCQEILTFQIKPYEEAIKSTQQYKVNFHLRNITDAYPRQNIPTTHPQMP